MQPETEEETAAPRPATPTLDTPIETPIEDAVEQAVAADPLDEATDAEDAADLDALVHRGLEVNEWDAAEQARTAGLEDDYR